MINSLKKVVRVSLGKRSYEVHIGNGIINQLAKIYQPSSKRAVVISDIKLKDHRARVVKSLETNGWIVYEIAVEAGEKLKDFENLYPLYGEMLNAKIDRSSTLFALGGGSVGDAAGFLASTYLRGISWVGLPTTLLGQVDSSIGGKTGINHAKGKNLIGSFYQPAVVVCDTDLLKTLSQREITSGLGEVIKYGLTFDAKFFEYINANWSSALRLESSVINELVKNSVAYKAKAVSKDEFDRSGVREVLNFGHTFGHALETKTDYRDFQHGEAVIWGMRFALALSRVKGKLSLKKWQIADQFLRVIPVPEIPKCEASDFFKLMANDKKAKNGQVRFVLLKNFGQTVLDRKVEPDELAEAFKIMVASSVNESPGVTNGRK